MRMRWTLATGCVAWIATTSAWAGGDAGPAVSVRVKSIQALQAGGGAAVEAIGVEQAVRSLDAALKTKLGPKGLAGIDPARPLGAFLDFTPDPAGALLLPVTDEKSFLDLLDRFGWKATLGKDGVHVFRPHLLLEASLKFSDGYAWITAFNRNAFASKRTPADLLGASPALASGVVRIDRLPKDARQLIAAELEERLQKSLAEAWKKAPPASEAQKALASAAVATLARTATQLLEGGKELHVGLDYDAGKQALVADAHLAPLPGSALAKSLTPRKSVFPGGDPGAFRASLACGLPEDLVQALTKLVEESFHEASAKVGSAEVKAKTAALLAALRPTLSADEVDAQVMLVGPSPDKKYGIVVGGKLREGAALASVVTDLVTEARKQMPEAEQAKVQIGAESAGMRVHRFTLPASVPGPAKDVLGASTLAVGMRSDRILFGLGAGSDTGLSLLAEAKAPSEAPLASVDVDLDKLGTLLAIDVPAGRTPGAATIRFRAVGGDALRARFDLPAAALRLLGRK